MTEEQEETYTDIRESLGAFIGLRVVDIKQEDKEDLAKSGHCAILTFENGRYISFPIGDGGFSYTKDAKVRRRKA